MKFSPRLRRATDRCLSYFLIGLATAVTAVAQDEPVVGDEPAAGDEAPGAQTLLERYTAEVDDFRAGFEQTEFDERGELVDEPYTGSFSLLRPNRFHWHQDYPYEELIVADGEWLWTYDVELEKVTREPLDGLATSWGMLLSGEDAVGEAYEVREGPSADGLRRVELLPVEDADSDFESATIAFDDGIPVTLEVVTGLGQRYRIEFVDAEVNVGLDDDDFAFEPPAGVDVVGADD